MVWSLISPANRGVGFALARHLLRTTTIPIVATARKDLDTVKALLLEGIENVDPKRLTVLELDVTGSSLFCLMSPR